MSATPPPRPRPGQVYEGPEGPLLWVRREAGEEVFAGVHGRVLVTRRFPEGEAPAELELVLAPAECPCGGAHYCHSEVEGYVAEIAALKREAADRRRERAALVAAMKHATESLLDAAGAKAVRDAYSKALLS